MFYQVTRFLQDFFSVSPKEARGIAGLLTLSVVVLLFPVFLKHYLFQRTPEEIAEERVFLDSLVKAIAFGEKGKSAIELQGQPQAIALKEFDPNNATQAEMESLGIPRFLARRVTTFREKGGTFRKKEDLNRIYDFPSDLYRRLEPYIRIEVASLPRDTGPAGRSVAGNGAGHAYSRPAGERLQTHERFNQAIVPFDINKADTTLLKRLKGIGSARAKTIVNYRNSLGGFYSQSQYAEIYGLDSVSLSQLRQYARILSLPRKIAINTVSLDEFLMHPYARKHRRLSEAIIRYREQHGAYRSRSDLEKVITVTHGFLDLLAPYLSFD